VPPHRWMVLPHCSSLPDVGPPAHCKDALQDALRFASTRTSYLSAGIGTVEVVAARREASLFPARFETGCGPQLIVETKVARTRANQALCSRKSSTPLSTTPLRHQDSKRTATARHAHGDMAKEGSFR
jgi:hypothetical protein